MTDGKLFVEELQRRQLMVAVRTETPEDAYQAAAACIEGGVRFIEITFSVPGADEVIRRLSTDHRAVVGAGTVLSVDDAQKALDAGAAYIVSPHCDEEVVRFTKKAGALSIPGACTPTEICRALRAGGDIIKLFPFAEIGGLGFLKAVRGPLPFVRYLLCGGATLDTLPSYLAAAPAGVLVGAAIIGRDLVAAGDWRGIAARARKFVQRAEDFRRMQNVP